MIEAIGWYSRASNNVVFVSFEHLNLDPWVKVTSFDKFHCIKSAELFKDGLHPEAHVANKLTRVHRSL